MINLFEMRAGICFAPVKGAQKTLQIFKDYNYQMALISNREHDMLIAEVEALGWQDYFFTIVGAGIPDFDKPNALHGHYAFEQGGFDFTAYQQSNNIIMVGDSSVDMRFAHNLGAKGFLLQASHSMKVDFELIKDCNYVVIDDLEMLNDHIEA